jgi:hypothetical protein
MKTKLLIGLAAVAAVVMMSGCASSKAAREAKAAAFEKELIESLEAKDFRIEITGMGNKDIGAGFYLKVKGDEVDSMLPYWGQGYSITFQDKGMSFHDKMYDYQWTVSDKRSVILSFKVAADGDFFSLNIEVFTNGRVYMVITPINKQSNSYIGDLIPFDKYYKPA